jgi:hypothetical protein
MPPTSTAAESREYGGNLEREYSRQVILSSLALATRRVNTPESSLHLIDALGSARLVVLGNGARG